MILRFISFPEETFKDDPATDFGSTLSVSAIYVPGLNLEKVMQVAPSSARYSCLLMYADVRGRPRGHIGLLSNALAGFQDEDLVKNFVNSR